MIGGTDHGFVPAEKPSTGRFVSSTSCLLRRRVLDAGGVSCEDLDMVGTTTVNNVVGVSEMAQRSFYIH
jgi:hypothetical protein